MAQETLASMIRAKYPDAYTDLSDQELERLVRQRYPGVYDDVPLSSNTPQTQITAGESTATLPSERTLGGQFRNFVTDLGKQAQGLGELSIPVLRGVRTLAFGKGQEKLKTAENLGQILRQLPGAVKDDLIKSYGSWEAVQRTAYEEPARFAMDLAALGGVVSGGVRAVNTVATGAKNVGRAGLRSTLRPGIEETEALSAGRGDLLAGQNVIAERAGNLPGMTPHRSYAAARDQVKALEEQITPMREAATAAKGKNVSPEPIIKAGEDLYAKGGPKALTIEEPGAESGARRTVQAFRRKLSEEGDTQLSKTDRQWLDNALRNDPNMAAVMQQQWGLTDTGTGLPNLSANDLREIMSGTRFKPTKNVAGSEEARRAMKMEASKLFKQEVPEAAPLLAQEAELIPVRDALNRVAGGSTGPPAAPHGYVRGGSVHAFTSIPLRSAGYPIAKSLYRTGGALQSNLDPRLVRLAVLGLLRPGVSHQ